MDHAPIYGIPSIELSMGTDTLQILENYLDYLSENDFENAAAQFTDDVHYRHPPIDGEYEVYGREDLYDYFANVRGPRDVEHEILKGISTPNKACMVVEFGIEDHNEIAVSYAEFQGDKISFYIGGTLGMGDPFGT
jgi:hypothetical protein